MSVDAGFLRFMRWIKAERGGCRFHEHSQATLKDLCTRGNSIPWLFVEPLIPSWTNASYFRADRTAPAFPFTFPFTGRRIYNVNSFIGDYVIITLVADVAFASRRSSTTRGPRSWHASSRNIFVEIRKIH